LIVIPPAVGLSSSGAEANAKGAAEDEEAALAA
jgi:hypothetical protein